MSDVHAGRQPVASRWVFKVQYDADESVAQYKMPIVAKCYCQIEDLDYDQTFGLVTRYDSLSLIIALARHLTLNTDQLHKQFASSHADLGAEICILRSLFLY